jgi:hypothetical protein
VTARTSRRLIVTTCVIVGLAGCNRAPTPVEFQRLAVTTLTKNAAENGVTLQDVACARPGGVQKGTVFRCTAAGEAGERLTFDALIDGPAHVLITPGQ